LNDHVISYFIHGQFYFAVIFVGNLINACSDILKDQLVQYWCKVVEWALAEWPATSTVAITCLASIRDFGITITLIVNS